MSYYDYDCFWTHEELGRKIIEQDPQSQGILNWLKQLLVYVADCEDHVFAEVNSQTNNQNQTNEHSTDNGNNQDSYRARLTEKEKI